MYEVTQNRLLPQSVTNFVGIYIKAVARAGAVVCDPAWVRFPMVSFGFSLS